MEDVTGILVSAAWFVGSLVIWPIARYIDSTPSLGFRLLKWAFLLQLSLDLLWGIWLSVLWISSASHIQHGLIPLYLIGTAGWIGGSVLFVYWLIARRKIAV